MALITQTTVANLLEKVIQPAINNQMRKEFIGFQLAKTEGQNSARDRIIKFGNSDFYIPLQTSQHSGAVAIAENGTLVNGDFTDALAKVTCKYQTGSQLISKQVINTTDSGSVVPILAAKGKALVVGMKADQSRQFYGTGDAVIGTAVGSGSAATSFVFAASVNGDIDYAEYCPPGTYIKIGSNAAVVVSAVTAKNTVTIPATTWSQGDAVKKCDGAGEVASEWTGMRTLLSNTAVFQNIDPATNPYWKPAFLDSTSEPLQLQGATGMNLPYMKANKMGKVEYLTMNTTLFTRYGELLTSMKRVADQKPVLGGGWAGLEFMGGNAKVVLDYDCPDDMVIFHNPSLYTYGENSPLEWEQGTNGTLLRVVGKINYEVVATQFGEFGCHARNGFAALSGKTG